jgi:hypothetical protein
VPSPSKTPSKIKMCRDDELNQTDTQSSAMKDLPTKTMEVQPTTEVLASSYHEESESPDKEEIMSAFIPQISFKQKEPQGTSQPQRIYQEESEDAEMQHGDEHLQRPESEEEDVN